MNDVRIGLYRISDLSLFLRDIPKTFLASRREYTLSMDIADLMKTFSSSRRMEVLESLLKGETRDEIKERVPTSTFAFTIDYLKKEGLADVVAGDVVVTDRGRAYLLIFDQFRKSILTLETLYATFIDHTIYFPDEFLPRLYEIADSEIVMSEPSNVLKPHRVFFENISRSREIMGVAPLLFPDYPEFFSANGQDRQDITRRHPGDP